MNNLRVRYNAPLNAKPEETKDAASVASGSAAAPAAPAWWDAVERPALPDRTRLIAGVVLGTVCLAALLWFWRGAAFSLAAALGLGAALRPPANWLIRKKIPYLQALLMLAGVSWLLLALVLLGLMPAWQRQSARYGQQLTELARRSAARTAALKAAAPAPAPTNASPAAATNAAAAHLPGAEALTQTLNEQRDNLVRQATGATAGLVRLTQAAAERLQRVTAAVAGRRWSLFFQIVFCSAVFLALPLLMPHESVPAPGVAGRLRALIAAGYGRVSLRFSQTCGARLVKAAALGLLTAIGLALAGLDAALFVAGCVGIFSLLARCGPSVGLVLALPMIPLASSWLLAAGVTAVLWVALIVAERKMYWYLQYLPALKTGWMPPPPAGDGRGFFTGLLAGLAGQLGRGLLSLAFLLVLAGFLYCVVPPYLADQDREAALRQAAGVYNTHNPAASITNYARLLQQYPNERALLAGLARSYADAYDGTNALVWADQAVNWQPTLTPTTNTLPMQIYGVVKRLRAQPPAVINAQELYEYMARQWLAPDRQHPPPQVGRGLGERLLKVNPQSAWGHLLMVTALAQEKDYPAAIEHARQGLAAKDSDTETELQILLTRCQAAQQAPPAP